MKKFFMSLFLLSSMVTLGEVNIYGPGGPAPVFKEIIEIIRKDKGQKINLKVGPTNTWLSEAKENGDLIFSGSEYMMNDFSKKLNNINEPSIRALKLREAGILVRKNNPKKIKSLNDLGKKDINIIVVDGAGQISLWEDLIGRKKDIIFLNNIRTNIKYFAGNSALATKKWKEDKNIDAVIIWKPWEKRFEDSSFIEIDKENKIYRPVSIALTEEGRKKVEVNEIYNEILSDKFDKIWKKHGWIK